AGGSAPSSKKPPLTVISKAISFPSDCSLFRFCRTAAISANLLVVTVRLIVNAASPDPTSATARSVWCHYFRQKLRERGGLTKIKSTPIVQNSPTSLSSVHGSPYSAPMARARHCQNPSKAATSVIERPSSGGW